MDEWKKRGAGEGGKDNRLNGRGREKEKGMIGLENGMVKLVKRGEVVFVERRLNEKQEDGQI